MTLLTAIETDLSSRRLFAAALISPKTENGASLGTTNATINQQLNQQQQLLCSYELQIPSQ